MEATFKSSDSKEINRLAKSEDMAFFIIELVNNGWRPFKDTNYDYHPAWDRIRELLEEYNINIDDLE